MSHYFSGERFGLPQAIGALLLIAFVAQCAWFCAKAPLSDREVQFLHLEAAEWTHAEGAQTQVSPATHTLAAIAAKLIGPQAGMTGIGRFVLRFPFLLIATALAGSLWYVSRRLFGNAGGYIATILYVFSPWAVIYGATVQPGGPASWAVFGMIFTGLAVAHTLYAPREVVLWNWKRILLLGISIGLAVSSIFATILLLPAVAFLVLYVAPHRRAAALLILAAACAVGLLVASILCGFQPGALLPDHGQAALQFSPKLYALGISYSLVGFLAEMPAVLLLLVAALVGFSAWPKTRYFSTTVPLVIFVVLVLLGIGMPHQGGIDFFRIALPFAYVFIAGVLVDVLQTKWSELATAVLAALLLAHAIFSVVGLIRM